MNDRPFGASHQTVTGIVGRQPADLKGSGLLQTQVLNARIASVVVEDERLLAYTFNEIGFWLHELTEEQREAFRTRVIRHLQGFGNLGFEAIEFLFDKKAVRRALREAGA